MKRMGAVESDSVKSAKKAKDKLRKACERASETCEQTLHGQEQNRMRMASIRESRDGVRFLVNTQVQSHPMLRRGFGTSVPFIVTEVVLYFVVQLAISFFARLIQRALCPSWALFCLSQNQQCAPSKPTCCLTATWTTWTTWTVWALHTFYI